MTLLFLFLPFTLQLVILSFAVRYVNRTLLSMLGKGLYLLLTMPGVVVHELSHLAACWVTFTRVYAVHLFDPHEEAPGSLTLGWVEHAQPSTWFATVLIGSAPFFGGSAVLWLLLYFFFPASLQNIAFSPVASGADSLGELMRQFGMFVGGLGQALNWTHWTTYLFFYLVLAISSHLVPSTPDMRTMLWALVGVVLLIALALWVSGRVGDAWQNAFVAWIATTVGVLSVLVSYGLGFVLLLAAVLVIVRMLANALRHRQP